MTNILEKKMVKFITNCSPYHANERAAFNLREAQILVDRKKAVYVSDEDEEIGNEGDEDVSDESNDGNESGAETGAGKEKAASTADGSKKKGKGKRRNRVRA